MFTTEQTIQLLNSYQSTRFIYIPEGIVQELGYAATAILSDLVYKQDYWARRGKLRKDGSFHYSISDMFEKLDIKEDKQRSCIKQLKNRGLLQSYTQSMLINGKIGKVRFFVLDLQTIQSFIDQYAIAAEPKEATIEEIKPVTRKKPVGKPAKNRVTYHYSFTQPFLPQNFNSPFINSSSSLQESKKKEEEKMSEPVKERIFKFFSQNLELGFTDKIVQAIIKRCEQMQIIIKHPGQVYPALNAAKDSFIYCTKTKGVIDAVKYFAGGIKRGLANNQIYQAVKPKETVVTRTEGAPDFYNWLDDDKQPDTVPATTYGYTHPGIDIDDDDLPY